MKLTPQRKKELLIGAGVAGALGALLIVRKKNGTTSSPVGSLFDPSSLLGGGSGWDPTGLLDGSGGVDSSGGGGTDAVTIVTPTDPTVQAGSESAAAQTAVIASAQPQAPASSTTTQTFDLAAVVSGTQPAPAWTLEPLDLAAVGPHAPTDLSTPPPSASSRPAPTSSIAKPTIVGAPYSPSNIHRPGVQL